MLLEDIVYLGLLLLSIWFGQYYRKIKDPFTRQWVSTLYGLLVVTTVSGSHVVHPIICTLVNAIIVTQLSWKYVHLWQSRDNSKRKKRQKKKKNRLIAWVIALCIADIQTGTSPKSYFNHLKTPTAEINFNRQNIFTIKTLFEIFNTESYFFFSLFCIKYIFIQIKFIIFGKREIEYNCISNYFFLVVSRMIKIINSFSTLSITEKQNFLLLFIQLINSFFFVFYFVFLYFLFFVWSIL